MVSFKRADENFQNLAEKFLVNVFIKENRKYQETGFNNNIGLIILLFNSVN